MNCIARSMRGLNPQKICFVNFKNPDSPAHVEPFALNVLGGRLKALDRQLDIRSVNAVTDHDPAKKLVAVITEERPIMVAISARFGVLSEITETLAMINRISGKDCPGIIIGGPTPSYIPEKVLGRNPQAVIVSGEGEAAIEGFYSYLLGKGPLASVPNIFYSENDRVVFSGYRDFDLGLAVLPYRQPEETSMLVATGGGFFMETSRGCHYGRCSFCPGGDITGVYQGDRRGPNYKEYPAAFVGEHFRALDQLGVGNVQITDPDFMGGRTERGEEIAQELLAINNQINFKVSLRSNAVFQDKDSADLNQRRLNALLLLKKAGLARVFLGVESLIESQRKRYNKGIPLSDNLRSFLTLRQLFDLEVGWIPIDPLMTLEEAEENIKLGREYGVYLHAPRPLNNLRLHLGISYLKMLERAGLVLGPFNDDYLWHIGAFEQGTYKDDRVRIVSAISKKWYEETHSLYYAIKNIVRIGNLPVDEAKILRGCLNDFKTLDIDFIYNLIQLYMQQQADQVPSLVKVFRGKKDAVLNNLKSHFAAKRLSNQIIAAEVEKLNVDFGVFDLPQ